MFVGLVMLVVGVVTGLDSARGQLLFAFGLGLGSLGGLELAVREHFSGYRSHSALLAGVPAAVTLGVLFYAGPDSLPPIARLAIGVAIFAMTFFLLVAAFRRRAGVSIKLR